MAPGRTRSPIPTRALWISGLALAVPLLAAQLGPTETAEGLGFLTWTLALIPGFLLAYYRGWRGSAVALAGGMAAITLSQVALTLRGAEEPSVTFIAPMIGGYLVVSIGIGLLSEAFQSRLMRDISLTDPETGLPTRTHLEIAIDTALASTLGEGEWVSCILIDVPDLGRLSTGDVEEARRTVFRAVAELEVHSLPSPCIFGRWSESEFLAILPHRSITETRGVAARLRGRFEELDLRWKPLQLRTRVAATENPKEGRGSFLKRLISTAPEGGGTTGLGPAFSREVEDRLPRCILAIPEPQHRRTLRRALELQGMRVEELPEVHRVPIPAAEDLGPVRALVACVRGRSEVRGALDHLDTVLPPGTPRVLFVTGETEEVPEVGPLPSTTRVLPGAPTADELLDLIAAAPPSHSGEKREARPPLPLSPWRARALDARVLAVDDEAVNLRALERSLREVGFQKVEVVSEGEVALRRLRASPPDLLILDMHMPEVDGFDVLEAVKEVSAVGEFFPVLVVTGDQNLELRQRALRMGAKDFLTKPFDVSELGARALNLIETRLLHQRLHDTNLHLEERVRERTTELLRAQDEVLFRLGQAVEYRDDVTGRHAQRVGEAAAILGEAIGLGVSDRRILRRAAPLHDIGKIAIPDTILLKAGPLDDQEIAVVQSHTTIGADLLANSASPAMERAREIALTHHEQWDGSGYPRGLRGDAIPLSGRIVAVVDALDVLVHPRPYKPAIVFEEGVDRIRESSGSHFDPGLIRALDQVLPELRDLMHPDAAPRMRGGSRSSGGPELPGRHP